MLQSIKGEGCAITCQTGTNGTQRYSSTHTQPLCWKGLVGQCPSHFTSRESDMVSIVQEDG
jgi:hypothetical protein